MAKLGNRATWGVLITSDRPRDVLKISEETEATLDLVAGLNGKNQAGENKQLIIIVHNGSVAPVLTDYPDVPVGTLILTPGVSVIFGYQRIVKSADDATDWNKIAKAAV
jgi:hypothetical protein